MGASRAKKEKAESGWIFREGHYVRKEEWLKAHPTKEMLAQTQVEVDAAVKEEMAKLVGRKQEIVHPDKLITVPEPVEVAVPNRYYCTACRKHHIKSSKIGSDHTNFYLAE